MYSQDYSIKAPHRDTENSIPFFVTSFIVPVFVFGSDPQTQVERLIRRSGLSKEEVQNRLAAQLPIDSKLPLADHVIDNSGDRDSMRRQVLQLHAKLESSLGYLPTRIAAVAMTAGLVALMWHLVRRLWQ